MEQRTCPTCGKRFMPWRGKVYCSEKCRKAGENRRLRGGFGVSGSIVSGAQKTEEIIETNQPNLPALRRYGARIVDPAGKDLLWTASNEITHKLAAPSGPAVAWVIRIDDRGWFARVHDERGDWAFGPSSRVRACHAAEAWLAHEVFAKTPEERMWKGDCRALIAGLEG